MEERVLETEKIVGGQLPDWGRAPADTIVCPAKEIYLRDIVQTILDGFETPEEVMTELQLTTDDAGVENIPAILEIFVPVINAWKSGSCGMGCAGCNGSCGG
ncbi:MAG: hypothetical protein IJS40_08910 [Synergistaceae bacterium]|nr:hypothetical protein [Synergistaceae bacterium]